MLIPAVGMRLWAEERRTGTIEFLMTLPITTWPTLAGSTLARATASLMAIAPSLVGGKSLSAPP